MTKRETIYKMVSYDKIPPDCILVSVGEDALPHWQTPEGKLIPAYEEVEQ